MHLPRATQSLLFIAILSAQILDPPHAAAQEPTDLEPQKGGEVESLGMPPVYKGYAGVVAGWDRPTDEGDIAAYGQLGVIRDFGNPVVGILALGLEGYAGVQTNEFGAGARGLFSIPALHFTTGLDYNVTDETFDWLVRFDLPLRRGGVFGRGTQLRIDWLPTRDQTFAIGISAPLWGRNIGQTRPRTNNVRLRNPPLRRLDPSSFTPPEGLNACLDEVQQSAQRMATLLLPLTDQGGIDPAEAYASSTKALRELLQTRSLNEEIAHYHAELDRAFSIAAGGGSLAAGQSIEVGVRASAAARRVLMDDVLIPYNRLLGQRKTNDGLDQFRAVGHSEFAHWVLTESGIPRDEFGATFSVFQRLVDIADEIRSAERRRWEESRLIWLPLQLALKAEDHDTSKELNQILERATGGKLTRGNHVWYVMNENFQIELSRSVQRAQDYHVLWIHDYRGKDATKDPDDVAFAQTVDSYMSALIKRVREYDATGKIPVYMVFLDQHYFEANQGRLFLRLLSDPLSARLSVPAGFETMATRWSAAQKELEAAVRDSKLLQVELSQYGPAWLHNRIKVHINITNPSDLSFQSFNMIGIIPTPDNMIRDHRKIAFYDINDEDPYRGMAMYTGMGVGEHYAGANWEDRAIIIRGPATLSLRDAARGLLLAQGFHDNEIPLPLRPHEKPADYDAKIQRERETLARDWNADLGEVMELHNETGYAYKPINVEKAILYTLMPPGSIIRVPDSLWQSYLYGSMLAGSALRGCNVHVIAPALATAPSSAPPTMARAHGLLSALVYFRNQLRPEITAVGGELQVGLYEPKFGVGDLRGRLLQAMETHRLGATGLHVPNPVVESILNRLDEILRDAGYESAYLVKSDVSQRPKLHLKANLFLSGSIAKALHERAEMGPVVLEYIKYLARQTGPARDRVDLTEDPGGFMASVRDLTHGLERDLTPEQRVGAMSYMTIGSTNMNYRSMIMDGEVQVLFTGWQMLMGLMDFWILEGLTEWIEDQKRLDELLPPPGGTTRKLANLMRLAL